MIDRLIAFINVALDLFRPNPYIMRLIEKQLMQDDLP